VPAFLRVNVFEQFMLIQKKVVGEIAWSISKVSNYFSDRDIYNAEIFACSRNASLPHSHW